MAGALDAENGGRRAETGALRWFGPTACGISGQIMCALLPQELLAFYLRQVVLSNTVRRL